MSNIIPILCNIRSLHNVGSIMRTCEGLGIKKIYTVGITPHMPQTDDERLPHVVKRVVTQLNKTALGAEKLLDNQHFDSLEHAIEQCHKLDYDVVALETGDKSSDLLTYQPLGRVALVFGPEVEGLSTNQLELCDNRLAIEMLGDKKSFNVSVAAGMALFYLSKHKHFK